MGSEKQVECVKYLAQGLYIILLKFPSSFFLACVSYRPVTCHIQTPPLHYHLQPWGASFENPYLVGLTHPPSCPACQSPPLQAEKGWHQPFPLPPSEASGLVWAINILAGPSSGCCQGDGLSGDWGGNVEVGLTAWGLASELALEGRVQSLSCCSSSERLLLSACLLSLSWAPQSHSYCFQAQLCPWVLFDLG